MNYISFNSISKNFQYSSAHSIWIDFKSCILKALNMWEHFQKFPVLIANNGKKSQCLTPAKVINEIILSMRNGFLMLLLDIYIT